MFLITYFMCGENVGRGWKIHNIIPIILTILYCLWKPFMLYNGFFHNPSENWFLYIEGFCSFSIMLKMKNNLNSRVLYVVMNVNA